MRNSPPSPLKSGGVSIKSFIANPLLNGGDRVGVNPVRKLSMVPALKIASRNGVGTLVMILEVLYPEGPGYPLG